MPTFHQLATLDEIPDGAGLEVAHDDRIIALFKVGDQVHAVDGLCPHQGGPLADGALEGTAITCPWHDWQFDLCSGKTRHKSKFQVDVYPVRVEEGAVWVGLPDPT